MRAKTLSVQLLWVVVAVLSALPALATIPGVDIPSLNQIGVTNPTFQLVAGADYLNTSDGRTHYFWGFGEERTGQIQYPGPILIVREGSLVTVRIRNTLTEPVSLIFPGQGGATAAVLAGGVPSGLRSLAPEAAPGKSRSYTFRADKPGTYVYESGTNMAKQVYLGLFGIIIVRPADYTEDPGAYAAADSALQALLNGPVPPTLAQKTAAVQAVHDAATRFAYGNNTTDVATRDDTSYEREYLWVQTELDPTINAAVERGEEPDMTRFRPVTWMYNGRTFPDTLLPDFHGILPAQPYGSLPTTHPAERVLVRLVTMGRDGHPFHMHGNHTRLIAHDGNLFQQNPANGVDRGYLVFTLTPYSGQTYDGIWDWTGDGLGWDMYNHQPDVDNPPVDFSSGSAPGPEDIDRNGDGVFNGDDPEPNEPLADHLVAFPTALPDPAKLTYGAFFSGTPFLGGAGFLPPGEGGFNPYAGYFFMWHSHTESEITTDGIFPGGMITMMGVLPYGAPVSY